VIRDSRQSPTCDAASTRRRLDRRAQTQKGACRSVLVNNVFYYARRERAARAKGKSDKEYLMREAIPGRQTCAGEWGGWKKAGCTSASTHHPASRAEESCAQQERMSSATASSILRAAGLRAGNTPAAISMQRGATVSPRHKAIKFISTPRGTCKRAQILLPCLGRTPPGGLPRRCRRRDRALPHSGAHRPGARRPRVLSDDQIVENPDQRERRRHRAAHGGRNTREAMGGSFRFCRRHRRGEKTLHGVKSPGGPRAWFRGREPEKKK